VDHWLKLILRKWEVRVPNLRLQAKFPDTGGFSWFTSVAPGKRWDNVLKYMNTMATSFQIFHSPLFTFILQFDTTQKYSSTVIK